MNSIHHFALCVLVVIVSMLGLVYTLQIYAAAAMIFYLLVMIGIGGAVYKASETLYG